MTWLHSYVSEDGLEWFCAYEAPSPEAIRRSSARNRLPVDSITSSAFSIPIRTPDRRRNDAQGHLFNLVLLAVAVGVAATWAGGRTARPAARDALSGMARHGGMPSTGSAAREHACRGRVSRQRSTSRTSNAAKADGYSIITQMIPDMGWHFLNTKITGFDPTKPPILVYEKHGTTWQLAALEWVFPEKPKTAPLPGARYGAFPAACHYADGTFVPAASQDACAKTAPGSGAAFTFWHPNLVTLHVWLWYPNPSGIYASMNPLVHPFNAG